VGAGSFCRRSAGCDDCSGGFELQFLLTIELHQPFTPPTHTNQVQVQPHLPRTQAYTHPPTPPNKYSIRHTHILEDPFDDPPQLEEHIPEQSPEPQFELVSALCVLCGLYML